MLKKALENVLTTKESDELISAFDQIGDIIIVRIPDSLLSKKKIIGEALLNEVKIVRSELKCHLERAGRHKLIGQNYFNKTCNYPEPSFP